VFWFTLVLSDLPRLVILTPRNQRGFFSQSVPVFIFWMGIDIFSWHYLTIITSIIAAYGLNFEQNSLLSLK